jgi:hypothetical protein
MAGPFGPIAGLWGHVGRNTSSRTESGGLASSGPIRDWDSGCLRFAPVSSLTRIKLRLAQRCDTPSKTSIPPPYAPEAHPFRISGVTALRDYRFCRADDFP